MRKLLIAIVTTIILIVSCSQPQGPPDNQTKSESQIPTLTNRSPESLKVNGADSVMIQDLNATLVNNTEKVKRTKRDKVKFAYLLGIVHSKPDRRIKFTRKTPKKGNDNVFRLKLDKEKSFEGKIEIEDEGYYTMEFRHRKYDLFITPGDSLYIEVNLDNKEQPVVFSGLGSGINNYIRKRIKIDYDLSMKKRNLYKLGYKTFSDTLMAKREALISELKDANKVSADFTESFYKKEKNILFLDWANDHFNFKKLALKYGSKGYNERVRNYNTEFMEELDLEDPTLLELDEFKSLITQYFNDKVDRKIIAEIPGDATLGIVITDRHKLKYKLIEKHFDNEDIIDFLRTEVVASLIKEDGTPTMNELILQFRKDVKNKESKDRISKYIEKYAYIDDGSVAPEFVVENSAGVDFKLSDFRGKYLYIDVWASWCGPCKHELPYFNRLKEEYKEKNIEFISISIDKTREPWERMLVDWQMNGHQYIAKGAWESDIAKHYQLKGVPQFILIDPEGQIIDLSAARPSGRIRNDFERLNI